MSTLEKRGRYYSIRYRDPTGKWHRIAINKLAGVKVTRKATAQEVFARWISERGTRFAPTVSGTLYDLLDRYRRYAEQSFTPDTFRSEMHRIEEFVRWCGDRRIVTPEQVTALAIEDFKADRLKVSGKTTVNRYLERVRAFFNQGIVWRYLTVNPFNGVRMLKTHQAEPRFLTDAEIGQVLHIIEGDFRDGVIVALQTGCRETELVRIRLADCRPDGIHFRKTKSYRPRTVPYAPGVQAIVDRRREAAGERVAHLFDNGRGDPIWSAGTWYSKLRLVYARAQIDGANFHSLRHTFATRLVRADVNLKVVQTLMGHADLSTTLRYVHLYQGDTARAVARIALPNVPGGI